MADYKEKIKAWQDKPETFNDWIKESDKKPTALVIPVRGGKVSFLYCLSMDDPGEQLLGARGFNTGEWCCVNPEDLWANLVPSSLAKKAKDWRMPTGRQAGKFRNLLN